jgi:hypothetical protein
MEAARARKKPGASSPAQIAPSQLQRKIDNAGAGTCDAVPPVVHEVLRSPGQSLDPQTRAFMELRFGHNFGQVRVRMNASLENFRPFSRDSLSSAQAPAWTEHGQIYLGGAGLLLPAAKRQQMLRHEMIHAVQQRLAPVSHSSESRQHAEGVAVRGEDRRSGFAKSSMKF